MVRPSTSRISGRRSLGERKLTRSLWAVSAFMREGCGDGDGDQARRGRAERDRAQTTSLRPKTGAGTGVR